MGGTGSGTWGYSHRIAAPEPILDRRPLASRRLKVIQNLAAALARRRIQPNFISVLGLIASVIAGLALAATSRSDVPDRALYLLGAALVQVRLLCNLLDGLIAVEGNMRSATGDLFNEVPDRFSDAAMLIGAGYAAHSSPALGYFAALGAILTAYVRALGKSGGVPSDYRGPMAKQHRVFLVTLCCVFLAAAPGSWRPELPAFLDAPSPGPLAVTLAIIVAGCVVTVGRRLASLARALKDRAG